MPGGQYENKDRMKMGRPRTIAEAMASAPADLTDAHGESDDDGYDDCIKKALWTALRR